MIDKIQTFGDSFMFGSDLTDRSGKPDSVGYHSLLTWPALAAQNLGLKYDCYAEPGRGNASITAKVLEFADETTLNIINWSWIDRYDYHFTNFGWPPTIRPGDSELAEFYYKNMHSEIDDKFRNLTLIYSTHKYLKDKGYQFISTYMDHLILDQTFNVPAFVKRLQKEIMAELKTFPDGQTFLEWSRSNGYPESDNWHPLERAHQEAAKFWLPVYEKLINTHITNK